MIRPGANEKGRTPRCCEMIQPWCNYRGVHYTRNAVGLAGEVTIRPEHEKKAGSPLQSIRPQVTRKLNSPCGRMLVPARYLHTAPGCNAAGPPRREPAGWRCVSPFETFQRELPRSFKSIAYIVTVRPSQSTSTISLFSGFGFATTLTISPAGIGTATRFPFKSPIASVAFSNLNIPLCMALRGQKFSSRS